MTQNKTNINTDTSTVTSITTTYAGRGGAVNVVGSTTSSPGLVRPPGLLSTLGIRPVPSPGLAHSPGMLSPHVPPHPAFTPTRVRAPMSEWRASLQPSATSPQLQNNLSASPHPSSEMTALLAVLMEERRQEKDERDRKEALLRQQLKEDKDERNRREDLFLQRMKEEKDEERMRQEKREDEERRRQKEEKEERNRREDLFLQQMKEEKEEERRNRREDLILQQQREDTLFSTIADSVSRKPKNNPRPQLKMPELKMGDDIDDFLQHFDSVASNYHLEDCDKILYLTGSLTEKARRVFVGMPPESTYEELQTALRKSFYLTAESYRRKFREARKHGDETFVLFGERLERTLESWTKMAETEIKDLILIEQLCSGINPDLVTRIREKKPTTFKEAIQIAEVYADARRGAPNKSFGVGQRDGRQQLQNSERPPKREQPNPQPARDSSGTSNTTTTSFSKNGPPNQSSSSSIKCFYCGKTGHIKKECKKLKYDNRGKANAGVGQDSNEKGEVAVATVCDDAATVGCQRHQGSALPTFHSFVEGHVVDSVRDTGATHVFLDKDLVPENAPRGSFLALTGIETDFQCTRQKVLVEVSTPYYKGKLWAVALEKPVYSLLIGNHVETERGNLLPVSTDQPKGMAAAVTTRAAAQRAKNPTLEPTLKPFPEGITLDVKKEDIRRMQQNDPSLATVRERADQPDLHGKAAKYLTKDGLVYREYAKGANKFQQLVVPESLRETVLRMGHDMPMAGHLGTRRTLERIQHNFYWPGINSAVRQYCRSCDACQKTTAKGRLTCVLVGTVPLVEEPCVKIGIGIMETIKPAFTRDHIVRVDYVRRRRRRKRWKRRRRYPDRRRRTAVRRRHLPFVVRQGQVFPEEDKAEKIRNAKPPTTKKELRAFLGLAGYYRKYVPNFATIAVPLTDKTKGKLPEKIKWDGECQKAFDCLKGALSSGPVLLLPDQKKPFTLRTDASGVGLGAVLMQDQGKGLQPVAYASKKLTGAELNYHTIELECMAVVWGIRRFYPFLYGRHFTLESDHHPLKYLDRIRPVSKRLMGWALELQSHSFDFESLKGVDNLGADYLSRAHSLD